jgi:two-component system alkaline phosphatase synthesis response regulator PhoP
MKNKILLIQSDSKLRKFIKNKLQQHFFQVEELNRGSGVREKIKKTKPHLLIIDIDLPDVRAESLCKQITRFYPDIPILIITDSDDMAHLSKFFKMGIEDFIEKPLDMEELITRTKARVTQTSSTRDELKAGNIKIEDQRKQAFQGDKELSLTPKEYSLLKFMIINKDRVVTRDMILDNVWGSEKYVNPRNVDIYIGYLRKKLSPDKQDEVIETVRGFGYKINTAKSTQETSTA